MEQSPSSVAYSSKGDRSCSLGKPSSAFLVIACSFRIGMGANPSAKVPAALYGIVLLMASIAYHVLQKMIINAQQRSSTLKQAIGNDTKGKVSMLVYLTASGLAIIQPWIAQALYVILAMLWLIPDRRIENMLYSTEKDGKTIK